MNDFVVYGVPGSPYLRSALLGLHEKGAAYRLAVLGTDLGRARSEEHLKLHPFGRIPILTHGDFRLYETQAILVILMPFCRGHHCSRRIRARRRG
jgi:glutathione S-transferase